MPYTVEILKILCIWTSKENRNIVFSCNIDKYDYENIRSILKVFPSGWTHSTYIQKFMPLDFTTDLKKIWKYFKGKRKITARFILYRQDIQCFESNLEIWLFHCIALFQKILKNKYFKVGMEKFFYILLIKEIFTKFCSGKIIFSFFKNCSKDFFWECFTKFYPKNDVKKTRKNCICKLLRHIKIRC